MTFRTSDILIGGCLIIIGLTEVAHLAGCLLGWSFLTITDLLLAEAGSFLLAAVLLAWLRGRRGRRSADKKTVTSEKSNVAGRPETKRTQILAGVLAFLILLQILGILTGKQAWLEGDMTLETVNTFLQENALYTINPLAGTAYTLGIPLRLKVLCLPTLYGTISRWTGMAAVDVVYRLIPCITLLLGYLAYGSLGRVLFPENFVKRRTFLLMVGILFSTGAYMPGVDGFDVFYGGFRGVTIRAVVLIPYLFSCLAEKRYFGVILCILAEACMVWTLYGAGACLLVTAVWLLLRGLLSLFSNRQVAKKNMAVGNRKPGEGDAE